MKIPLTQEFVKRLKVENKPVGFDSKGKILYEPNETRKRYFVGDASQDVPTGFGIRVDGRKTYYVQQRTGPGSKDVRQFAVCSAGEYTLADAREKAREMVKVLQATGMSPNKVAKRKAAAELTLGQVLEKYRNHLEERTQRPASKGTLKVIKGSIAKFERFGWADRKVRDITTDEIMEKFVEGRGHPTANEQNFRWASAAVRWCIDNETLAASAARREPTLTTNPFVVLQLNAMYRNREQLERGREENAKRNPLGPTTTLGKFLEAAWSKRQTNDNATGCDYLILMILLGCRSSEHAACVWGDLLDEHERKRTSHVWLHESGEYGPYIFVYKTKNGRALRLPLGRMSRTLLERRQEAAAKESAERGFDKGGRRWVFPAKSKFSKTGHYTNAMDLLGRIRDEAGIVRLARHDLRRSFGAVMTTLDVPYGVKQRFLNHADGTVTDTYTRAEWMLLSEWMTKMEQYILTTAPNIYNSLKPVEWPPLKAPEPHVCASAKPRTGRPPKAKVIDGNRGDG
jgi:integrase